MSRPFAEYIPLSHRFVSDSVVWLNNKNGMYSVQSRYHVARKVLSEENRVESSKDPIGQQVWRNLGNFGFLIKSRFLDGEHTKKYYKKSTSIVILYPQMT